MFWKIFSKFPVWISHNLLHQFCKFFRWEINFQHCYIFLLKSQSWLQIRDGDQGYSKLINKYCGSKFPPIITSSGRSLWLRFVSDGTIEYSGFKAVYDYIPNPMEIVPFIPKCEFEIGGNMDYLGKKFYHCSLGS